MNNVCEIDYIIHEYYRKTGKIAEASLDSIHCPGLVSVPVSMTINEENPLVSVVMATYIDDNPLFLRQAVESILRQTYGNIELLIVADGALGQVVAQYLDERAHEDPRIRILKKEENMGPGAARNAGISAAAGEYIAIMDADDISIEDRIERQLWYLRHFKADLLGSFYYMIDERGSIIGKKQVPVSPDKIKKWMAVFSPISNPTVFARAEVMKHNLYDSGCRVSEDYNLWIRLLKKGYVLMNQPEYLVSYRQDSHFLEKRQGLLYFNCDLKNKILLLGLYNPLYFPIVIPIIAVTVLSRLMPRFMLNIVYRLRNILRFTR